MNIQFLVRIIAIIDLVIFTVLSGISYFFAVIIFHRIALSFGHVVGYLFSIPKMTLLTIFMRLIIIFWVPAVFAAFLFTRKVFASWVLIKGTARDVDSIEGDRLCVIWQKRTLASIAYMILYYGTLVSFLTPVEANSAPLLAIIVQIIVLGIVEHYKRELRMRQPVSTIINGSADRIFVVGEMHNEMTV